MTGRYHADSGFCDSSRTIAINPQFANALFIPLLRSMRLTLQESNLAGLSFGSYLFAAVPI